MRILLDLIECETSGYTLNECLVFFIDGHGVGDKISESHVDMGNERKRKTYAEVTKEKTSKQVNETKAVRFIL